MWEEIEAFVKHLEGSIPQSVAIATVKASQNVLHFMTTYEVSWNFFNISELTGKIIFHQFSLLQS